MPTTKPELSAKNPYHIGKERYLELKHFCAQIPLYNAEIRVLQISRFNQSVGMSFDDIPGHTNNVYRPTEIPEPSEHEQDLNNRIAIFSSALNAALPYEYSAYRLQFYQAVTGSVSYDKLIAVNPDLAIIPRDKWYVYYRKFFCILDGLRH